MIKNTADQAMNEPSRIKQFRTCLIKKIPRFPNNRASLKVLEAKPLAALLVDYVNYAIRYIAPRPRQVIVESTALNDPRWSSLSADIQTLLCKVEEGEDITPHLSLDPHTHGFTPAASAKGPHVDRWADKDQVLNCMGYHHFHLDAAPTKGWRSDDLVFAHVTRSTFTVVGVFDHSVFAHTAPTTQLTPERQRLLEICHERATRGAPPGTLVVASLIANSGHSDWMWKKAADYTRMVYSMDPMLDDESYVNGLYKQSGAPVPARPRLRWDMHYLDLCLMDKVGVGAFGVIKGPN